MYRVKQGASRPVKTSDVMADCCCCGPVGGSGECNEECLQYIPSVHNDSICQCGHKNIRHRVIGGAATTDIAVSVQWNPSVKHLSIQANLGLSEVGSVMDVDLASSGLRNDNHGLQPTKLYVRAACIDLWQHLEDTLHRVSFVTGCSGVGKSVEVYAYAMWQATVHKRRILYIHSHGASYTLIVTTGAESNDVRYGHLTDFLDQPHVLLDFIRTSMNQGKVDIIVLDGQLSWLIKCVFLCLQQNHNVRLISCTSFQAISKLSTEQLDNAPEYSEFLMDSWMEQEYVAAISAGALELAEDLTVDEMFFYAGGSVRMIQWNVERVTTCLTKKMRQISDMSHLLGKQVVGDSSECAMNTLMAMHSRSSMVLSRFVLTELIKTMSTSAIIAIRSILPLNTLWQGWVTELEVLLLVKNRKAILFRLPSGASEHWPRVDDRRVGLPLFVFDVPLEVRGVTDDWLLPKRWNQGCFDGLYRPSPDTVKAIQITIAEKHSCKLKYLIPIVEALDTHVVELVYVCRRSNFESFKVPTPQNEPTSTSSDAATEHKQYLDLMTALEVIWRTKTPSTPGMPPPSLMIRKLCYEQIEFDRPLE